MSKMRARMLVRRSAETDEAVARKQVEELVGRRHGPETIRPISNWRNGLEELWHRVLHVGGIHWYIVTEIYDMETGVVESKGAICWLCPEEMRALKRRTK